MAPPSKISSCTSGIAFWVTQVGWQFLSTLILWGSIHFWAKNYLENVLEYHFWGKGHFSRVMKGIFLKLQKYVRGQNRGFWVYQTHPDGYHIYFTCWVKIWAFFSGLSMLLNKTTQWLASTSCFQFPKVLSLCIINDVGWHILPYDTTIEFYQYIIM